MQATGTKVLENCCHLARHRRQTTALNLHYESKKLGHFFTAYNFRNIEQIFTKLGINHVLFVLNITP